MNDQTPVVPADIRDRMHQLYRHLHAHPELSMQEHQTASVIEDQLSRLGVEHFRCAGTGVVGILRNGEGPTVAFRADTDALPLQEKTGLDFASEARGELDDGTEVPMMHGCGHDTHIVTLLAAVEVLLADRESWAGTVVLIFQPGEETAQGAAAMVEDGLWEKAPHPEVVFGQHVMPARAGTLLYSVGDAMALADSLRVTVQGKGSHASQPQDSVDPVVLGAHMVTRLQGIVSREIDPRKAAVLTVATFHAGLKENIIPDSAEFSMNIRTLDPAVRDQVLTAVERVIRAEAAASGAPEPTIEVISSFPRNYNDPEATQMLVEHLRARFGDESVKQVPPFMGSEDFGALATAIGVPSVFWMFGGHDEQTLQGPDPAPVNHSPFFAPVIEPTLSTGAQAAVTALLSRLGQR